MSKSTAVLALASARAEVTRLLAVVKSERESAKFARESAKAERLALKRVRAETRAERKAERVAKLEAKLAALKSPVVGVKAMRANRKPSKVTVLQGASA
jgi:hypothetical protein